MLDLYVGNLSRRVSVDDVRDLFDGVNQKQTFGLRQGLRDGLRKGLSKSPKVQAIAASLLAPASWAKNLLTGARNVPQDVELTFTMVECKQGQFGRYCRISGYTRGRANKLIEQFSGVGFQGQALEVRPFHSRDLDNDRRRAGWHFRRWLGVESRAKERRLEK